MSLSNCLIAYLLSQNLQQLPLPCLFMFKSLKDQMFGPIPENKTCKNKTSKTKRTEFMVVLQCRKMTRRFITFLFILSYYLNGQFCIVEF